MLRTLVLVLSTLGLIQSSFGQIQIPGQCPQVTPMQNFNAEAYLNRWFLVESYPNDFQSGSCIDATYTLPTGSSTINVVNTQVVNQALASITGTATLPQANIGSFQVTFPNTQPSTLQVLDTDYTSYALVYSCTNVNGSLQAISSWKLSRTRTLSAAANNSINAVIATIPSLDNDNYQTIDHSSQGCFFFAPVDTSRPVRLRTRCNGNLNAVPNFNLERYMNQWHLIESYPSSFQTGTCNSAHYTLGSNGVTVFNTQVVNQNLATITGLAVPTTTDGSAIFGVTFPSSPTPSPYVVLATDYDSYALVYSCVEVDNEFSDVWSWKLSRTQQLTAAANTAINAAIAGIQELDARYYQTIDRTPAACFYFPEPQPGVPVTFPGECSDTVPVVQNFDRNAFSGIWHEIESYPTNWQQGQCISHEIGAGTGLTLTVQSSQILNQSVISSTANIMSTGTTGAFTLSVVVGNQALNIPLFIVDTDYTSYALAYSCFSRNPGTRLVYSWKFSRTQSLSAAAQVAINTAIAPINVLDQRFFQEVDQSSSACFVLPDFVPGVPVVFPGQCDQTIPVVQNFNAQRYAGNWRLIETYPTNFQNGVCNQASYTLNADVSVTVVNSEVVNERLATITGRAVLASTDGSARLRVTFPSSSTPSDYWVLATDYDSYALVYSCANINPTQRRVTAWKLSRDRTLSAAAVTAINQVVNSIDVLNDRFFTQVPQTEAACFYYPQWDTLPGTITLPGSCDTTIRGVANFNAAAYLGRWFEIERYPQQFQAGQCNRAEYSSGGATTVNVFNSQVINQELRTISGTAVPATTDGTGQLTVSFNVGGSLRTSNLYVLATDYNTFSLAYSCRNLENGNRQVSSWKLSRTTALTSAANTAINNVIASTQGLLQDYYRVTDQSEQACFYIPEFNADQPVLFRGSCPNLNGQANFNVQRYLGWWHHINNYPTGEDTGTCLSTQYQQSGNQIQFVDTQVFGLTAQVTRGTVTANTNGSLVKTWNNGNSTQEITVLATDYDSYSLIFTCEEAEDGYVKVWSSMQSKSRSLTAANEQAINAVIANSDFLRRDFFLAVNQSNDACFHYPETTNRVTLPGQCDSAIPVQANFDIAAYSGTWYQIERYPYPEVSASSTCIGTRFTQNSDNSIDVLNWEVVDGELNTIEGQATIANGSSVLVVSLPGANGTSQARLHILTTDYTSFALAFTCENINSFERVVVAIKLSRSRSLTAAASTAINTYMATREELHQPLFISVEQSDDCEEPNSSFLIRSSIFVVLLCYAINMLV